MPNVSVSILSAVLLVASLHNAAVAQQPRITLVERDVAPGARSNSEPSIIRKQLPGLPDRIAYRFSQQVHVGSPVTEVLEISFNQPTTLSSIEASNDFKVVSASCRLGLTYSAGESCQVSVTLDPKGPGKRAGKLTFTTSESAAAEVIGLQGQSQGPVVSFIPAQITTVPQTMPGGKPLLNNSWDVVTDQGDNLYISDATTAPTSGGKVYFIDGSMALTTLVGGGNQPVIPAVGLIPNASVYLNDPAGIAVDAFLDVYIAERGNNAIDVASLGSTGTFAGLGSTPASTCFTSTPCALTAVQFNNPVWINLDSSQNIFMNDHDGAYSIPSQLTRKINIVTSNTLAHDVPFGLDSTDNIYSPDKDTPSICQIDGFAPLTGQEWNAAGSGICGFAANNVRSQNAEIRGAIGGFAFDEAGDMYFADSNNNIIRRVDSYNGLIRTVAGIGTVSGYSGDNGPATSAALDAPHGISVDSMGEVFVAQTNPGISSGPTQFVRKVGPAGNLLFPVTLVGHTSPVATALITNTGNDYLEVSNVILGGANPGDFISDAATSSCVWSQPLASGRSCQLGFSCKPTAGGWRTATITFVDNTAGFQNQLYLNCDALTGPAVTRVLVNPPASGTRYIAGSSVPFEAVVTNTIGPPITQPTGTVNMTVTNTGNNSTAATFANVALFPVSGFRQSNATVQYWTHAAPGTYSVVANYSGDALDSSGASAAVPFSVVQVTPTVAITVPANNGQFLPGAITAAVQVSNAGLLPTAPSPSGTLTVVLTNTGTNAKTTFTPALSTGTAGVSTTNIPLGSMAVGNYSLSASYSGDTADTAASATAIAFSVVRVTPSVTITSPASASSPYLTALTYSAQVSNAGLVPAVPSAPTGNVTFTVTNTATSAKTTYGPYTLAAGSGGKVSISVPNTQTPIAANYSITASYGGDTDDAPATSAPVQFSVTPVTPIINWPVPAQINQGTALSATQLDAAATYASAAVPGTYVYNPPAGTVENTPGQVQLNVTFNPTDSTDYNSATGSVTLTVRQTAAPTAPTLTVLSAVHNPAAAGETIQLNATVNSSSSAPPTGWVTLWEGGKLLTSAALNGGKGTLKLTTLTPGTHSLVATYSGDTLNGTSNSEPFKQVVERVVPFGHDPVREDR
ncbi:MAG TPA: Ig-like domain repeat protein [Terracidiphilus sp.]|nr:Ig-like domain repeat protein [Terracidiphilus sp.]